MDERMHIPPNILTLSSCQVMDMEEGDRHYQLSVQLSAERGKEGLLS